MPKDEQKVRLKINTQSHAPAMYLDENFNKYKTLSYSALVFYQQNAEQELNCIHLRFKP